ncbi:hypothetical protein FB563_6575 [Streptomyces puniciscabiei]|uniref:Uncharacterized protein n=1 Tax=Streptomyces puniciscabiei TaxID=164348 RepID=A0A542THY6_9ACTN|nr:hypothetical protein [Streptomyces puniciscabiei]TQK86443.1 hypothetical protein FB563_6575 [Streptomyces puniciscabiei]
MSKGASTRPRVRAESCGSRLPTRRAARNTVVRRGSSSKNDWLLLPGGSWRHVETIRVRSLFG